LRGTAGCAHGSAANATTTVARTSRPSQTLWREPLGHGGGQGTVNEPAAVWFPFCWYVVHSSTDTGQASTRTMKPGNCDPVLM